MILFGLVFSITLCFAAMDRGDVTVEIVAPSTAQTTTTSQADSDGNMVVLQEYQ